MFSLWIQQQFLWVSNFFLGQKLNILVALFHVNQADTFFVTRAKATLKYETIEGNFNIDQATGLRTDKTIALTGYYWWTNIINLQKYDLEFLSKIQKDKLSGIIYGKYVKRLNWL